MGCKYLLDLDGEDFRKKNSDDTSHLMILVSNKRAFHLCISLSEEKGREDQSAYDNWIHCKFSQYVIAGMDPEKKRDLSIHFWQVTISPTTRIITYFHDVFETISLVSRDGDESGSLTRLSPRSISCIGPVYIRPARWYQIHGGLADDAIKPSKSSILFNATIWMKYRRCRRRSSSYDSYSRPDASGIRIYSRCTWENTNGEGERKERTEECSRRKRNAEGRELMTL